MAAAAQVRAAETVLFTENFETGSETRWNVFSGSSANEVQDFTVNFDFDYANTSYTSNGVSLKIPVAPSGPGTKGVKMTVNNNDTLAEASAVNIYPKDQTFSSDFALRFDMWINYNGPAFGGTGSTEFGIFGINHTGDKVNWAVPGAGVPLPGSDGLWFGVTGEAGAAGDYRVYEGDPTNNPLRQQGPLGGFLDRNGDGTLEEDVPITGNGYPMSQVFHSPPYETRGVPGKRWVQVEVRQKAGLITWVMNGYVIAEFQNSGLWTTGTIMLGTMDIFNSIASPAADNFVIFDNVQVVDISTAAAKPRLWWEASVFELSEPNTTATLTLRRSGDLTQPLTVFFRTEGMTNQAVAARATPGVDYRGLPISTNFPAGVESMELQIAAINDLVGEPDELFALDLVHNTPQYEVFAPMTFLFTVKDDGDTSGVNLTVQKAYAYEKIPADAGIIKLTRVGDMNSDLRVNFTVSGSAVSGTDYQAVGTSAVIPAGTDTVLVKIVPIDNNLEDSDRTVTVTLATGTGYQIGTETTGTVTIRNDDIPDGTVAFSDNFDTETSQNWVVNEAHPESNRATFNWNYSEAGIPSAPNSTGGTTFGLKLEANTGVTPTFTGLSVSPLDKGFEGDYRLSFDMWINFNGPLDVGGTGSTMSLSAGVGTSGDRAQFPGTSVEGVLFSATGDGGSGSDWRAYAATGAPLQPPSGVYAAGTQASALNNTDPYYAIFGGREAPEAQLNLAPGQTGSTSIGAPGIAWHEVTITKIGTNITWAVDNYPIATIPLTNKEISTNIFVGFFDINATQTGDPTMSFGLVDNLKVELLETTPPPAEIRITRISKTTTGQIEIEFTTTGSPTGLAVVGSEVVQGPYNPEPNAQITVVTPGATTTLRATIPMTTGNRFFQIRQ